MFSDNLQSGQYGSLFAGHEKWEKIEKKIKELSGSVESCKRQRMLRRSKSRSSCWNCRLK
jgi:hypothetical protein